MFKYVRLSNRIYLKSKKCTFGLTRLMSTSFSSNNLITNNLVELNSFNSRKTKLNKDLLDKLSKLPVELNTNNFDLTTLDRLYLCSNEFLTDLVINLHDHGIRDKQLANMLKSYDDWSLLTRENLSNAIKMFRDLSFTSDIYLEVLSRNSKLFTIDKKKLESRLKDFKDFFTNKHLTRLLKRSPGLLTINFDSFRYKFTYVFALMGISQDEMGKSYVFDYSMNHIRERHLFLLRSGFYVKPTKNNSAKIVNPKINTIMDTNLKEYLRMCTNNLFNVEDYETFCDYLRQENFDDELLGLRIGSLIEKQIISSIKFQRREDYLNENE